ncbi:hypothetical protein BDR26DRAFT_850702 [Obelidium mucronatum]|nr:hypothetical protein BDR26DRAFT_850702 [Obelidium mucronatum]
MSHQQQHQQQLFDASFFFDSQKSSTNTYPMLPPVEPVNALSFFFLSANVVNEIPAGYHLGGAPVVPSSPVDALASPLESSLSGGYSNSSKGGLHPLLCPQLSNFYSQPDSASVASSINPLDIFRCASPEQSPRQSFEFDLQLSSDSTNNTPALGHLSSPRFEHLVTLPSCPSSFSQLPSASFDEYPAFIPSQPLVVPSQPAASSRRPATMTGSPQKLKSLSSPADCNSGDSRKRTRLSNDQREYMMSVFDENNQPNTKTLKEVAATVGTSLRHVQYWFQNRRAAMRRRVAQSGSGVSDSEDLAF